MTKHTRFTIDQLIEIVENGGTVKTGVDVYNTKGVLLLDKDILVNTVRHLEVIKENGIKYVPVNASQNGGLWDHNGKQIKVDLEAPDPSPVEQLDILKSSPSAFSDTASNEIEMRLVEIEEMKSQAKEKYNNAKDCIKKVLTDIKQTGGEFDYDDVESRVSDMVNFLGVTDNPFSYLTHEIFSYDDYLYNHSINVCTIGTAMLNRFNGHFSSYVDHFIKGNSPELYDPFDKGNQKKQQSYTCYYEDDINDIALGFFLHDVGKTLVPDALLNKQGKLTPQEYEDVKKHSFEYGMEILDKNFLKNSFVRNIVKYHHAPLFKGEERAYPLDRGCPEIPLYARICKLADIFDAMTSKRSYKDAFNPITVVTELFRKYAKKDNMLQFILHSFVKSIGIYPPGSIVYLRNGQMAYVLESDGPIVIPFTDTHEKTLRSKPDPINIKSSDIDDSCRIDNRRSVKTPKEVYDLLPTYLRSVST